MPPNKVDILKNVNHNTLLHLYKPLLIIFLLCGYHFDFYRRNIIFSAIAQIYCLTLTIVIIISTLVCCEADRFIQIWSLIEYTLSVLLLLCIKSRIRLFFQALSDIDCYLRINRRHYICTVYKLIIFIIIIWCVRLIYSYIYCLCYECYNNLILYAVKQFSLLALDLNRVWRCLLFDTIRYRLKILRMRLEEYPEYDFYLFVKDNKSRKENKIKFCLYLYRSIADLVDIVSPELHASLFLTVACSLPKLILNVYYILTVIEGHAPTVSLGFVVTHLLQISLLLFTPFIIVEFYAIEVEKIRLFLIHRLIDRPDSDSKEDVEMFLRYTELRTFKYKIWRIIPINAALPLELANLCTSYVIVIINFTHLYG